MIANNLGSCGMNVGRRNEGLLKDFTVDLCRTILTEPT